MLIKLAVIACAVAVAAAVKVEHGGRPLLVPQVGISKGVRSQSPDIIYLIDSSDDHHDGPLRPHGPPDQNTVIASIYGPAFLRREWIIGQDPDQYGNSGLTQYGMYERDPSCKNREQDHKDPYGSSERNREIYGTGNSNQYGRDYGSHERHHINDNMRNPEIQKHREHDLLLNNKRVRDHEQLLELNRLREQKKLLEIKRLIENAQLKEILREKDREIQRQRSHRPSIEMLRVRELERQQQLVHQRELYRARDHVPIVENVGERLYPKYDTPVAGGRERYADAGYGGRERYADAGYGERERSADAGYSGRERYADAGYGGSEGGEAAHGWGPGYKPAWARLPDVSFNERSYGMGPKSSELN